MRKCNFLRGLPLVNLQAATLINTLQTNVSQHCHANINHSDVSFLTSVSPPLAAKRCMRWRGGGEEEEGEERRRGGGTQEEKRETFVYQKQGDQRALRRGGRIKAAPSRTKPGK